MGNKPKSLHAGHRQRLKQRYLSDGLDSFNEHQILELLLFFGLPQGDTNELAHRLLTHYGSLPAVLEADYEDLQRVNGMGAHSALLLTLLPNLWRYYQLSRGKPRTAFNNRAEIADYTKNLFIGAKYEVFYLICLDTRNKVTQASKICEGTIDHVNLEPRLVAEAALRHKAKNVVFAHNHPGGSLKPTSTDMFLTNQLAAVLSGLGIGVLDHIIVADGNYLSFWEKGLLSGADQIK